MRYSTGESGAAHTLALLRDSPCCVHRWSLGLARRMFGLVCVHRLPLDSNKYIPSLCVFGGSGGGGVDPSFCALAPSATIVEPCWWTDMLKDNDRKVDLPCPTYPPPLTSPCLSAVPPNRTALCRASAGTREGGSSGVAAPVSPRPQQQQQPPGAPAPAAPPTAAAPSSEVPEDPSRQPCPG